MRVASFGSVYFVRKAKKKVLPRNAFLHKNLRAGSCFPVERYILRRFFPMPFGAHEALEVHEILNEKVCMIDHLLQYEQQAGDPTLKDLIRRHRQSALRNYNEVVSYTHDYRGIVPSEVQFSQVASPDSIQYGLRNPAPVMPIATLTAQVYDEQICRAILLAHKNSAKNNMAASLECADPYLRQMLMNSANTANYNAYEVFEYMNARGLYQVPTMRDHTAKTMLHTFQPL
jgi:spore coat protein CotF